jgi:hypothetical protein
MKTSIWFTAAIILAIGSISGCGGSGSENTAAGTTNKAGTAISGKVADGYLVGATVFLDKNVNYQLDADEPSAITDDNGAYSLTVDPADVGKYPVVVLVTQGVTIDKDTNLPVASSYILSMPKESVTGTVNSNFISPVSSLVREMMESGLYTRVPDAKAALRTRLGLPAGSDIMSDYVANNDAKTHTTAQNMARLMGSQRARVFTNSSTGTVDVNRYRGMMGTMFSNMSSIRGSNANAAFGMSHLLATMERVLANMPPTSHGIPFRNMSAAFRGRLAALAGNATDGTTAGNGNGTGNGNGNSNGNSNGNGHGQGNGNGNGMMSGK